jgi:hypothetical protein
MKWKKWGRKDEKLEKRGFGFGGARLPSKMG